MLALINAGALLFARVIETGKKGSLANAMLVNT
jgi:hypothetical protein